MELSDADFDRLKQFSSELVLLLGKLQPPADPDLDALVAQRMQGYGMIASSMIPILFPGVGRRAVALSLQRLGWRRHRTRDARMWVAPVTAPVSATAAT